MPAEPTFSYSTAPLPVKPSGGRRKYREEEAHLTLMSDPRVVRGSVSNALKRAGVGLGSQESTKLRPPGSRKVNTSTMNQSHEPPRIQPTFFFDVDPVVDPHIDLRSYLEEDSSQLKPASKLAVTQTDEFNERPDTPEYVPRKTGIDRSTQVEKLSELFVFDEEVEPMLQVIVSKTLEQALFEIEREEELLSLERECERFRKQKVDEQEWVKKREQETIADAVVKDLALKGLKEKQSAENEVRTKVASRRAIVQLLPSIVDDLTRRLFAEGIWRDPNRIHICEDYLPEIYKAAAARAYLHDHVVDILDDILFDANEMELERQQKVEPLGDNAECGCGSKTVLKLILPKSRTGTDSDVEVGPIAVHTKDTISSIENRIKDQLDSYGIDVSSISLRDFIASAMGYTSSDQLDPDTPLDNVRLPQHLNIFV